MRLIDNDLNFTDGTKIINSNLNYNSLSVTYSDIDVDAGQIYVWDLTARSAYTIEKVALQSDAGTITATVKINGVAVIGLTEIDATTNITDYTGTALNAVAIGDKVTLTIDELIDSPTTLDVNIYIKLI